MVSRLVVLVDSRLAGQAVIILGLILAVAASARCQTNQEMRTSTLTRDPETIELLLQDVKGSDRDPASYRDVAMLHLAAAVPANWQLDREAEYVNSHVRDARSALRHLVESDAVEPADHVLLGYALLAELMGDRSRAGELFPKINDAYQAAVRYAPEDDRVVLFGSLLSMMGQPASAEAMRPLEAVATRIAEEGLAAPSWWDAQIFNLLSLVHTFYLGDPASGGRWAELGLGVMPDSDLLRFQHRHARAYTPVDLGGVSTKRYRELATDPAGDASSMASADATSVAISPVSDGMVWLRVTHNEWAEEGRIGFNIIVDSDRDQSNGEPWWGETKGFRYDSIVTLWIVEGDGGVFHGMNGYASAADAKRNQMVAPGSEAVGFAIDRSGGFLYIGCDAEVLCGSDWIIAVGSNRAWSDDMTGSEGSAMRMEEGQ